MGAFIGLFITLQTWMMYFFHRHPRMRKKGTQYGEQTKLVLYKNNEKSLFARFDVVQQQIGRI